MPKLCLNMIVRNEADKIERCLAAVADYIDYYAIVDTGSTDDTIKKIQNFMSLKGIEGVIGHAKFKDFSQARNAALKLARKQNYPWDYLLLVDADMILKVEDPDFKKQLTAPAHNIVQRNSGMSYENTRFLSRKANVNYVGVTHEYLDIRSEGRIEGVWFDDRGDGTNRDNKFRRDIIMLKADLRQDPDNPRSWFYLAQSYKDNQQPMLAVKAYQKRIALGGWDEEVWCAQYQMAICQRAMGNEAEFIRNLLIAYNMRPSRAEPLWELARHYREKGMNLPALMVAEEGLRIPYPKDLLFVGDYPYKTGFREEYSITAYYDPARRDKGFKVCNWLALDPSVDYTARTQARANMFYYAKPLSAYIDTFKAARIDFTPPDGYTAMNPSVTELYDRLQCIVRTVNYTMDEAGRYLIKGTNGEANGTNPIHTRNFLVELNKNLTVEDSQELLPPEGMPPPEYNLVVGFEDMRLFGWKGDLWAISNLREQNPEGWCEQFLTRLPHRKPMDMLERMHPLDLQRHHQKNWAPWVIKDDLQFMYRAGTTIDLHGNLRSHNIPYATDNISGGTQVIPFEGGYLTMTHEAYAHPSTGKRYYLHRFMYMDPAAGIMKFSLPFYFHDKVIEFAAGLAMHPDRKRLVISYGREDKEAWLATVDAVDVKQMVWDNG